MAMAAERTGQKVIEVAQEGNNAIHSDMAVQ
jgi:hypothetical protein